MWFLHLTEGHKKVFPDVRMFGFKNSKNLKTHFEMLKLPDLDEVGVSKPCWGNSLSCFLCENMKDTCTFKNGSLFNRMSDMWWAIY